MGAEAACEVVYAGRLKTFTDPVMKKAFFEERVKEYQKSAMGIEAARQRGFIDEIIEPQETRSRLIADLKDFMPKNLTRRPVINKKHGNIPL